MPNLRRILVVEDEDDWRDALVAMYQRIFPHSEVCSARDGDEALRKLRKHPVDLLSQDINLATQLGPNQPRLRVFGKELLRKAHEEQLARAVIVITALTYDEKLRWAVPDVKERRRVGMTVDEYLIKFFPGRSRFWSKVQYVEARVFVKDIEAQKAVIQKLVADARRYGALEPPYTLFSKRSDADALYVRTSTNESGEVRISRPADVEFLELLVRCHREKVAVPKESVVATLNDRHPPSGTELERMAASAMAAFRARLKSAGITQPSRLVDVARRQGWVLHNSVNVNIPRLQVTTYIEGVRYE